MNVKKLLLLGWCWWVVFLTVVIFLRLFPSPSLSSARTVGLDWTRVRALSNFLNLLLWQLELKALNSETASPGDKALHYVCPPSLIEFADLNYLDFMPNIICPDNWMGSTFQPGLVRSRTAPA